MMDCWWNVAAENQANDRVHRIGQTRKVRVVRFVMANSIEERMVSLQEAKAAVGKGAMEKLKPEEVRKARIGDLKNLFDLTCDSKLD
jgi:SNF2 family DNA or RNA helicase